MAQRREREGERKAAAAAQTGKTFDITEAEEEEEEEANARFALRLLGKRVMPCSGYRPTSGVDTAPRSPACPKEGKQHLTATSVSLDVGIV